MKTFITMILDETGSMMGRRQTAIDSTNEFINAHREVPDCFVSLVTFDKRATMHWSDQVNQTSAFSQYSPEQKPVENSVRYLFKNVAAADVPAFAAEQYNPRGMTNLYDAVGTAIRQVESDIEGVESNVIIMVNTDGEENASTEFTGEAIRALMEEKKNLGWQIVFIGEAMDTTRTARMSESLGISASHTLNCTGENKAKLFRGLAAATTSYVMDYSTNIGAAGPTGEAGARGDAGVLFASYLRETIDDENFTPDNGN